MRIIAPRLDSRRDKLAGAIQGFHYGSRWARRTGSHLKPPRPPIACAANEYAGHIHAGDDAISQRWRADARGWRSDAHRRRWPLQPRRDHGQGASRIQARQNARRWSRVWALARLFVARREVSTGRDGHGDGGVGRRKKAFERCGGANRGRLRDRRTVIQRRGPPARALFLRLPVSSRRAAMNYALQYLVMASCSACAEG